jgi:cation diffusion facilitator CzcD-associated flavoprotein CzcO
MERFAGRIVHPQRWPEDLDYAGKRVVVIGSGATAVTLLPSLAQRAAHVTMLQRSPTYIVTRPARDKVSAWLRRHLPEGAAHRLTRSKNILLGMYFYQFARRRPELVKRAILGGVRRQLGADYDVDKHFTPAYNPWDQRLCLVPDGDLFKAIAAGRADIVTDHIASFTETGLLLRSGQQLEADIIVTATGLQLKMLGGLRLEVDGVAVDLAQRHMYKGMMCDDLPNLAFALGYTNASWTLKCELTAKYVCRLLRHMDAKGYAWCAPRWRDPALATEPALALRSGYVQRAAAILPSQGSKKPWKLHQNYLADTLAMALGAVDDGTMEFGRARAAAVAGTATPRYQKTGS